MGGYGETASYSSGGGSSADKILTTFAKYKESTTGNIEVEGL